MAEATERAATMADAAADPAGQSPPNDADTDVVVSPEEALAFAIDVHQKGGRDVAERIYRDILRFEPDNAVAMHYLGVLMHQKGEEAEALQLLGRALELAPNDAGAWLNLGNVLVETGRANEAIDAYQRAAELAVDNAQPYNNLGVVLRALGKPGLAEEALRKAIDIAPNFAAPWHNLGNLLLAVDRVDEAIQCGLRALTLAPAGRVERQLLGTAYAHLGKLDAAREVYRSWLDQDPGNPLAIHYLAALGGDVPARASDRYVEATFDSFASSFDAKLEHLGYRAPGIVAAALATARPGANSLDVLDAGCGTGLCGPLLRPSAATLVGLDLSRNMLGRARNRKVYDELVRCELTAYLEHAGRQFDAIVAADALCYFGRLEALSHALVIALRPGGVLIATFEAGDDAVDVHLHPSGRYAHGAPYLRNVFAARGLTVVGLAAEVLRLEHNRPVDGWLLTLRRD